MEDVTSRLVRLDQLRAAGTISEAEFDKLKDKLINDSLSGAPAAFSPIASEPLDEEPPAWRRLVVPASVILVVLIVIFGFPLVSEGAGNECGALEQGAVRKFTAQDDNKSPTSAFAAGFIALLQRASNGAFASNAAKARYPNLPPAMACTMVYYRMTFGGSPDLDSSPEKTVSTEPAPGDQAQPQGDTQPPAPDYELQQQATISPERPALPSRRLRQRPSKKHLLPSNRKEM
jgi:hypothetical protein